MRGRAVWAIGGATALAGCSLFVELKGLREEDAGPGTDASMPDVVEAAASDASDASAPDVFDFVCPDASSSMIVCDDFDDSPLGARWTNMALMGAALALDSDAAVSAPNALWVTAPPNPMSINRHAKLVKSIGSRNFIQCDLDFRLDNTDAVGADMDTRILELDLNAPGYTYYTLYFSLESAALQFEQSSDPGGDAGSKSRKTMVSTVTKGVWQHLRFTTNFKTAQVAIDNVGVFDQTLQSQTSTVTGQLNVGLAYDSQPPFWDYRIDDVLCVATP